MYPFLWPSNNVLFLLILISKWPIHISLYHNFWNSISFYSLLVFLVFLSSLQLVFGSFFHLKNQDIILVNSILRICNSVLPVALSCNTNMGIIGQRTIYRQFLLPYEGRFHWLDQFKLLCLVTFFVEGKYLGVCSPVFSLFLTN